MIAKMWDKAGSNALSGAGFAHIFAVCQRKIPLENAVFGIIRTGIFLRLWIRIWQLSILILLKRNLFIILNRGQKPFLSVLPAVIFNVHGAKIIL